MSLCLQEIMFDLFITPNIILEIFISGPCKSNHILNSVFGMKIGHCDRSVRTQMHGELIFRAESNLDKFSL
jgi:hypothetical protein